MGITTPVARSFTGHSVNRVAPTLQPVSYVQEIARYADVTPQLYHAPLAVIGETISNNEDGQSATNNSNNTVLENNNPDFSDVSEREPSASHVVTTAHSVSKFIDLVVVVLMVWLFCELNEWHSWLLRRFKLLLCILVLKYASACLF